MLNTVCKLVFIETVRQHSATQKQHKKKNLREVNLQVNTFCTIEQAGMSPKLGRNVKKLVIMTELGKETVCTMFRAELGPELKTVLSKTADDPAHTVSGPVLETTNDDRVTITKSERTMRKIKTSQPLICYPTRPHCSSDSNLALETRLKNSSAHFPPLLGSRRVQPCK